MSDTMTFIWRVKAFVFVLALCVAGWAKYERTRRDLNAERVVSAYFEGVAIHSSRRWAECESKLERYEP